MTKDEAFYPIVTRFTSAPLDLEMVGITKNMVSGPLAMFQPLSTAHARKES